MTLLMVMNLGFAWGEFQVQPRTAPREFTWNVTDSGITYNQVNPEVTWNVVDSAITKDTY